MKRDPRVVFVFVDGLGLGCDDPAVNPVHSGVCPNLESLLREHAIPIDARLGVAGYPQSATGQAALLTGVNAAAVMGRHVEGFPGATLKELIRRENLFSRLKAMGRRSTFANAYFVHDLQEVQNARRQSVTTVAAMSAFGGVRTTAELGRNEAVYQDLTRLLLRGRGYAGPLAAPSEAAEHLRALAAQHDLTLFEYFQTDRAGHGGDPEHIRSVLAELDEFLGHLTEGCANSEMLLVLTSDHGNIEDARRSGHTLNPVPFVALGPSAEVLRGRVKSIVDVTPALLALWRGA